jgi:hypothetical protein
MPVIKIPPNAKQISISFVVGNSDGSSCAFYLWSKDGKTKLTLGTSANSRDTFVVPGAPNSLDGQIVEWDFTIYSYTGDSDEAYSVTVAFLADGALIHAVPETGTFTKVISFRDGATFQV